MDNAINAGPDDLERSYQDLLGKQLDGSQGHLPDESPSQSHWQLDVEGEPLEDRVPGTSRAPHAAATVPPPVSRILEALLFVGGPPLSATRAAEVIRNLSDDQFRQAIAELNQAYGKQGRPYVIQPQVVGYMLALRPGYRFVIQRFQAGPRQARLSAAAVDVLAIVAYRQPVSRREVESLRGHESGLILRQLVRRGLVAAVTRAESGGREVQYGTTQRFLALFGLGSLDELPQTEDLQKL